jgi:hypothetical protein
MGMHEPTAIEQARRARELREKFFGKPVITNRAVVQKPQVQKPDYAEQIDRLETLIQQAANICEILGLQIRQAHVDRPVGTLKEKIIALSAPILERHGVTFEDILSRKTMPTFKEARKEAWRAAYEALPAHSINEISQVFQRHYTTLSDAARSEGWDHSKRMQTRPRQQTGGAE